MNYLDDFAIAIRGHVPANALPDGDLDTLFRLYAVLGLAKGEAVTSEDVHNAWAAWMLATDPAHDSVRPFGTLDDDVQASDEPYTQAIRLAARERAVVRAAG